MVFTLSIISATSLNFVLVLKQYLGMFYAFCMGWTVHTHIFPITCFVHAKIWEMNPSASNFVHENADMGADYTAYANEYDFT